MHLNDREFLQRGILEKISDHKFKLILFILLFIGLSIVYLMVTPKSYTTNAVIEIEQKNSIVLNDKAAQNQSSQEYNRHISSQIEFLQSRSLIKEVIDYLDANIQYSKEYYYLEKPITYDELPITLQNFTIKDKSFYGKVFRIKHIDSKRFELSLMHDSKWVRFFERFGIYIFGRSTTKTLIYKYNTPINTPLFDLTIYKKKNATAQTIFFSFPDPQESLNQTLKKLQVVRKSKNSSMIEITYSDFDPKYSQKFVNTLMEFYLKHNINSAKTEIEGYLKIVSAKIEETKKKLNESEKSFQTFIQKNSIAGLDNQTANIITLLYQNEQTLQKLRSKRDKLKVIYKEFQKTDNYKNIIAPLSEINNKSITKLVDLIIEDEKQYKTVRKKYKEKHPDIVKIKKSIDQKLKTLDKNLKVLLISTERKIKKISNLTKQYQKELKSIPNLEMNYEKHKLNYSNLQKKYLELLDTKQQLLVSKAIQGNYNYHIIDYAYVPKRPSKPKKAIVLLLGAFLGTVFGLFYILIREYFTKKIKVPAEVVELTTLPYLGTIPYISDTKLYNSLYIIEAPNSIGSQMIWSLRSSIDFYLPISNRGKIVAITSMIQGEGKTTIAANLATSLGLGDKKTVVLSLDLHASELHTKFGIDNKVGASDLIFGTKNLSEIIYQSHSLSNLSVIPSGQYIDNPVKIINSNDVLKMLDSLRSYYDYIVIDLPPISAAAETIFLMKQADLCISILKANQSEKSFIIDMEKIAHKYELKNVGFVLNSVNKKYIRVLSRKENKKYIQKNQKIKNKSKPKTQIIKADETKQFAKS